MIALISDFNMAIELKIRGMDFKVAWHRVRHMRHGHPYKEKVKTIDTLTSEKHPHSGNMIFTIHICECKCGLIYFDSGLERRK